jgi:hypothetical protein
MLNTFIAFVIWLEIIAATFLFGYQPFSPRLQIHHDPRIAQLAQFESKHHFAPNADIKEIIKAGDSCHLNPALLVAIELQESSGGKHYIRSTHNKFGWASDTRSFESDKAAVDYISEQFCTDPKYGGKSPFQIAQIYGPHDRYDTRTRKWLPSATYAPTIIKYIKEINVTKTS